jgi:hypothetical protein
LRASYLFDLAAVCHCPPQAVDSMRLADFAVLVTGIDALRKQAGKEA